jgi:hypothetical protein
VYTVSGFFGAVHQRVCSLQIKYFTLLRTLLILVLIEIYFEHIADAEHIRLTSIVTFSTLSGNGDFTASLFRFLMSSSVIHLSFLWICTLLAAGYVFRIGGLWTAGLMFVTEWIFQIIHTGNLSGHQGAIHQFLPLLVIIEGARGRMPLLNGIATALLRLQLVMVYFMSGLSKILSPEWQSAEILQRIFLSKTAVPMVIDPIFASAFFAPVLILAIKILQISFPAALAEWRGRKIILGMGVLFHLVLALKLSLYFFGIFMVSLYLVF